MFKTMKLIEFQIVYYQQLSTYNNVTVTRLKAKNSFQGYCYAEEWHPTLLWPRSPISATAELLFLLQMPSYHLAQRGPMEMTLTNPPPEHHGCVRDVEFGFNVAVFLVR